MKKSVFIFIINSLAILIYSSCTSTYRLNSDFSFSELDHKIREENIKIILANKKVEEGYKGTINNFRMSWVDLNSGKIQDIETKQINEIIITNHSRGALEGLGLGILAFFPLGAIGSIGAEKGSLQGGIIGLMAVIGGPIIGAAIGHKNIYILNDPQHETVQNEEQAETVKVAITSINVESGNYFVVNWNHKKISLKNSEILKIERKKTEHQGESIFITISQEVYKQKFRN